MIERRATSDERRGRRLLRTSLDGLERINIFIQPGASSTRRHCLNRNKEPLLVGKFGQQRPIKCKKVAQPMPVLDNILEYWLHRSYSNPTGAAKLIEGS